MLSSIPTAHVWGKVSDLPVSRSTCITLHGQLLAVGGDDSKYTPTSVYHTLSNSWQIIDEIRIARYHCFADVLSNDQLIVVGGLTVRFGTDVAEMANVAQNHVYGA